MYSTLEIRESAVKAYLEGYSVSDVSKLYHVHRATVYRWIEKYEKKGHCERKRKPGSGRPTKLTKSQIKKLTKMILKPASKFGFETDFWTAKRIIEVIRKKLKVRISKSRMCEILHEGDFSYKKPEKRYYEADPKKQKEWIETVIPQIKRMVKKYNALLYFEDEASVSMCAVLGKTWGPIGETVIQKSTGIRGSISAMSAITSGGALIFRLYEKKICSAEVIEFLDQMLKHHPTRHLVVIMDQATPHISKKTKDFIQSEKRLHVFYLPARSPEFNPDEKVWNYLKNQALKGHQAKSKEEMKSLVKKNWGR